MEFILKLLGFIFITLTLVCCDKGRKSFDIAYKDYKPVIGGPITKENFAEAKTALLFFKLHSTAHANEGSGKDAERAADQIRDQFIKFGDELYKQTATCSEASKPLEDKIIIDTDILLKEIRNRKKSFSSKVPKIKVDECFISDRGKEFDNRPSYHKINITKVEKVGERSVLVKVIFDASASILMPSWTEDMKNNTSKEIGIALYELSNTRLDCPRAEALIQEFGRYTEVIGRCNENIDKLNFISALMKETINK